MIPFSPPRIDQKIIDEVVDTLKSGWITTGPKTKLFESRLNEYFNSRSVLCVNSATAGMELTLRWFGVGKGDEVILPAYTYSSTANVVIHCGAKPVLVDIGDDFNLNVENIRSSITTSTKAIMPVDFGGWPCDYDGLNQLIESSNVIELFNPNNDIQSKLGRVLLLSDSAHSLGAAYKGKRAGSLADISVFSFHAVKNLTTAEGGAIAINLPQQFNTDEIYKYLNILSLHGQTKDALAKSQGGNWRYDIIEAGYKCNMTDIQASMGLVELERYESETLPKRKSVCDHYSRELAKFDWANIPLQSTGEINSSYHLFPLRINGATEQQRDKVIEMMKLKGVSVNVHFLPIPLLSFYSNLGYEMSDYPNAYRLFSNEISLPVYFDITTEQLNTVVQTLNFCVCEVLSVQAQ